VLYPQPYLWLVAMAAADVVLTHIILGLGGSELNALAAWALERFAVWGAVGLKFSAVIIALCVCEFVGRRRPLLGRRVAEWAVALNVVPVTVAAVQIAVAPWLLVP
jgi:hypothetical protein